MTMIFRYADVVELCERTVRYWVRPARF